MKMNKLFMKKLLIIILSVFILVPIVLMLFGYDKNISEGFFSMENDGYTESSVPTTKITAIYAPGKTAANAASVNVGDISHSSYPDVSNGIDKLYCVLGEIDCADGYDASLVETTSDGVKIYTCKSTDGTIDNTKASCKKSIFSGTKPFNGNSSVNFYKINENGCRDESIAGFQFKSFESQYNISSNQFNISGNLDEFTGVYNNTPLKFTNDGSGDYVILQDVINDTNWKDISLSTCFMFKGNTTCEQSYANCSDLQTSGNNSSSGSSSSSSSGDSNKLETRCLGDFGDEVGDKLCCGQTGVIQNEHVKYTCPESHPYCRGYKCGDSWGSCYKED